MTKIGSGEAVGAAGNNSANITIDCTSVSNYKNLTIDDFFIATTKALIYANGSYLTFWGNVDGNSIAYKNYNSNTGILTLNPKGSNNATWGTNYNWSLPFAVDVYLK